MRAYMSRFLGVSFAAAALLFGAPAGASPTPRTCLESCTQAKRECITAVRVALGAAQAECRGDKATIHVCRRAARVASRPAKTACIIAATACRQCCREGGGACAVTTSTTTTTDTVPTTSSSSTTTTPSTSSTSSSLAPRCGNGVIEAGETCDPDASPNGCFAETPFCVGDCGTCSSLCSELVLTLDPATGNCGFPGQGDPASPPLSGELRDASNSVTTAGILGLGCLNIGGGLASIIPPGPFPDGSSTAFHVADCSGNPLALQPADTGDPATCTLGPKATRHCANGHPGTDEAGACTQDSDCQPVCVGNRCIDGSRGADGVGGCADNAQCGPSSITGSPHGVCLPDPSCYFGNPVPIANGGTSICLVNVVGDGVTGTADRAHGAASIALPLESYLYLTGLEPEYNPYFLGSPCPRCEGGVCTAGRRKGLACSSASALLVTPDCPPGDHLFLAAIDVAAALSTSDTTVTSDPQGIFCAGQTSGGAFGQSNVRTILEHGAGSGLLDVDVRPAALSSVFCIPLTGNLLVDASANLPGPAAVTLGGSLRLR
jgi:hypothetical protein